MAIAHVASLGTTQQGSSSTTTGVTTGADAESGNLVYVGIRVANVSTVSGNTNDITSCDDSAGGNTWTKVGEYTQTAGVAGDGTTTAVFRSRLANTIASGGTVTVTHANAGNRAMMVDEFTVGGAVARYGSVQTTGAAASTNPGSQTVSGLVSAAYMGIRYAGMNINGSISSGTASWTGLTGAAGNPRSVDGEFRVNTATTFTSAPTLSGAADSASVMEVISDATIVAPGQQGLFSFGPPM